MQRRFVLLVLIGAISFAHIRTVRAQASDAAGSAAGGTAPAAPMAAPGVTDADLEGAASDESAGGERGYHLLDLSLHGALVHAHQDGETSRARGAFGLALGVRAMRELEISGAYEDSLADWSYAFAEPAADGAGPNRPSAFEHQHVGDLFGSWDFEIQDAHLHLLPRLGFTYVGVASEVFASQTFGGGGGLAVRYDLDPRTALDAMFRIAQGFSKSATGGSLYGAIRGLRNWSVGVSLGSTDWSSVRLAYVGEALVRQRGTRWGHGTQLSLHINFL